MSIPITIVQGAQATRWRLVLGQHSQHAPAPFAGDTKPFTIYPIQVEYHLPLTVDGDPFTVVYKWSVLKRFREFDMLQKMLVVVGQHVDVITTGMKMGDNTSEEALKKRCVAITELLNIMQQRMWTGEAEEIITHFLQVRQNIPLHHCPLEYKPGDYRQRYPHPEGLEAKIYDLFVDKKFAEITPIDHQLLTIYFRDFNPYPGEAARDITKDAWDVQVMGSPEYISFREGWELVVATSPPQLGDLLEKQGTPMKYIYAHTNYMTLEYAYTYDEPQHQALLSSYGASSSSSSSSSPSALPELTHQNTWVKVLPTRESLDSQYSRGVGGLYYHKFSHLRGLHTKVAALDLLPMQCFWTENYLGVNAKYVATIREDGSPLILPVAAYPHPRAPREYHNAEAFLKDYERRQALNEDSIHFPNEMPPNYQPTNCTNLAVSDKTSIKEPCTIIRMPYSVFCQKSRSEQQRIIRVHKRSYDAAMLKYEERTKCEKVNHDLRDVKENKNGTAVDWRGYYVNHPLRDALLRDYNTRFGRTHYQPAVDAWFTRIDQWENVEVDIQAELAKGVSMADAVAAVAASKSTNPKEIKKLGRIAIVYQNINPTTGLPAENIYRSRTYRFHVGYDHSVTRTTSYYGGKELPPVITPTWTLHDCVPGEFMEQWDQKRQCFLAEGYPHRYTPEAIELEKKRQQEREYYTETERQQDAKDESESLAKEEAKRKAKEDELAARVAAEQARKEAEDAAEKKRQEEIARASKEADEKMKRHWAAAAERSAKQQAKIMSLQAVFQKDMNKVARDASLNQEQQQDAIADLNAKLGQDIAAVQAMFMEERYAEEDGNGKQPGEH